jgi:hypothetical protein
MDVKDVGATERQRRRRQLDYDAIFVTSPLVSALDVDQYPEHGETFLEKHGYYFIKTRQNFFQMRKRSPAAYSYLRQIFPAMVKMTAAGLAMRQLIRAKARAKKVAPSVAMHDPRLMDLISQFRKMGAAFDILFRKEMAQAMLQWGPEE